MVLYVFVESMRERPLRSADTLFASFPAGIPADGTLSQPDCRICRLCHGTKGLHVLHVSLQGARGGLDVGIRAGHAHEARGLCVCAAGHRQGDAGDAGEEGQGLSSPWGAAWDGVQAASRRD